MLRLYKNLKIQPETAERRKMGEIFAAIGGNIGAVHIVLFALGIICMVIEMFEPGIGIFGAAGLIIMVIDIFVLAENVVQGFVLFALLALLVTVLFVIMMVLTSYGIIPKKLVLTDSTENRKGYTAVTESDVKEGDEGTALTQLRPAGKARFGEKTVDVVSDGEFIESGTKVTVISVVGNKMTVKTVKSETE